MTQFIYFSQLKICWHSSHSHRLQTNGGLGMRNSYRQLRRTFLQRNYFKTTWMNFFDFEKKNDTNCYKRWHELCHMTNMFVDPRHIWLTSRKCIQSFKMFWNYKWESKLTVAPLYHTSLGILKQRAFNASAESLNFISMDDNCKSFRN